jgi:3',5'-cyclic-AMP phosphodiesterase
MTENRDQRKTGDGIDRRGMLKCMAWVGTGLFWTVGAGIPGCTRFGETAASAEKGDFSFAQISDSHIGFSREPNKDVTVTLQAAIDKLNALPERPAFLLHTGDLTHLAKPREFDTVAQLLKSVKVEKVLYVPGEHDFDNEDNKLYLERFGKGTKGTGWHSFDYKGVRFIGLVNVANARSGSPNGLGVLGQEQLDWLKKDVAALTDSTPVVVFAHVPLWMVYEKWGWGTKDAEQALALLKRFGSVTVLNGHIHQIMQKIEGKVDGVPARAAGERLTGPRPGCARGEAARRAGSVPGILRGHQQLPGHRRSHARMSELHPA